MQGIEELLITLNVTSLPRGYHWGMSDAAFKSMALGWADGSLMS